DRRCAHHQRSTAGI
ncbi:polyphosphate kinase 1, partial [Escherichia coli 96.0932]